MQQEEERNATICAVLAEREKEEREKASSAMPEPTSPESKPELGKGPLSVSVFFVSVMLVS